MISTAENRTTTPRSCSPSLRCYFTCRNLRNDFSNNFNITVDQELKKTYALLHITKYVAIFLLHNFLECDRELLADKIGDVILMM